MSFCQEYVACNIVKLIIFINFFQTDYIPNIVTTVLGELASVAVEQHISVFKDCQHTATLGFGKNDLGFE